MSNEKVYRRCGIGVRATGNECGVVEWIKQNSLRWFGHIRKQNGDFVKKVHEQGRIIY